MNKPAVFLSALAGVVVVLMTSCSRDPKDPGILYMPDMYTSPSYEVYSANPNFPDSITMQTPVNGTVPVSYTHLHPFMPVYKFIRLLFNCARLSK